MKCFKIRQDNHQHGLGTALPCLFTGSGRRNVSRLQGPHFFRLVTAPVERETLSFFNPKAIDLDLHLLKKM